MTDIGPLHYYFGIEVNQATNTSFISQSMYTKNLLRGFDMEDYNTYATLMQIGCILTINEDSQQVSETLFRQLVRSLIYLITTRLGILFPIGNIFICMHASKITHWNVAKKILRYIKGTLDLGLKYTKVGKLGLNGYNDSN